MPYAIELTSGYTGGNLELDSEQTLSGSVGSKSYTIEFTATVTGNDLVVASQSSDPLYEGIIFLTSGNNFEIRVPGRSTISIDSGVDNNDEHKYKIVALNGSKEFFVDDVSIGVSTAQSDEMFDIAQFFIYGSSSRRGILNYFKSTDSLDSSNDIHLLNTSGTGSVWPDTSGNGNDATQTGSWPTDDSEWVFYSTGPNTPINPSITNLLATSARLNWEQG